MSTPDSSAGFKTRMVQGALIVALVAAVFLCIWYASDVLLLLFAGILLAIVLRGATRAVSRLLGVSDGWSLAIVAGGSAALIGLAVALLTPEVNRQVDELSRSLPASIATLRQQLETTSWGRSLVLQLSEANQWISQRRAFSQATTLLSTTLGVFAGFFIMLALALYLAADPKFYTDNIIRLVPPRRRERAREVLLAVGDTLQWWFLGKLMSMTVIGVLTWIGLVILGVPLALTLSLIAALLTFIPNFGPIVAVVPAALLALVESPMRAVYVLLLYLAIQTVESYLVTPMIQRRTIRMPPALTISAQLLMGAMLGILGVALATPLTAALIVFVQKLYVEDALERAR